jgi:hypothetical protein
MRATNGWRYADKTPLENEAMQYMQQAVSVRPAMIWRGWITSALVIAPCGAALTRQALYYKGDIDGFGWVMFALAGFFVGGVLNLASLYYFYTKEASSAKAFRKGQRAILFAGHAISASVAFLQLGMFVALLLSKAI